MKAGNSRRQAASILEKLLNHQGSLASLLDRETLKSGNDFAFIQELCFGVCRHYQELDFIVALRLKKPLRKKDLDIHCLLLVGLYQILYMRVPDHAAINETVSASTKSWAKGLVNGVLRDVGRSGSGLPGDLGPDIRLSHPKWLVDKLQQDWPDEYLRIMQANNARAPLTLRVNINKTTRASYLEQLSSAGISASAGNLAESAILLDEALPVPTLPGFEEGLFSVQDESSQLSAFILPLNAGLKVLDCCAAPGGKTCAMLEKEPALQVLALDNDLQRLEKVKTNLQRLNLTARTVCADASDLTSWWDKEPFDCILLDAPCSATGVIRRHPDIKVLRTPGNLETLREKQQDILATVWGTLKPGGYLLYSTCSTLLEENNDQISAFIQHFPDARHVPIAADWGLTCEYGRQLLPGAGNYDGFYYALLQKC